MGMIDVIYRPLDAADPQETTAFNGVAFKAGEPTQLDERFKARVMGNPWFSVKGERSFGDDREVVQAKRAEREAADPDLPGRKSRAKEQLDAIAETRRAAAAEASGQG